MNEAETRAELIDPKLKDDGWDAKVTSGITTLTFPDITVTAKTDDAVNDAVNDAVKSGLNDALIDAVKAIMADDKGVSINEVMIKTGKSNATVKRYLQILKAINLIEFKGSAKTGKYSLTKRTIGKLIKKTR